MMELKTQTILRYVLLILTLTVVLFAYDNVTRLVRATDHASAAGQPMVATTVLDVDCPFSWVNFGETYTKIADIGSFTVLRPAPVVEVTFNGRIYVYGFQDGASGAKFELRIDDQPTTNGRARATLRDAEAGHPGVQSSITGIFTGLTGGTHTVNMWVKGVHGSGGGAMYDHGCFRTDHVVIKEYVPFGAAFLPLVSK